MCRRRSSCTSGRGGQGYHACRVQLLRLRCDGPHRARRPGATCVRARMRMPAGKSPQTPPPPCAWIAQSMHLACDVGSDHLDHRDFRLRRLVANRVHHPRRTSASADAPDRSCSAHRRSVPATRSDVRPASRTPHGLPGVGTSVRARARPDRSSACSDEFDRVRGDPAQFRTRGLHQASCCRPAPERS